ncbi:centrosomal protein of 290 kDa isoform X2 [Melanerpes formicivorus]|uniref:centrosomal protein of 290 kDa isoform X2 n=1 Tax=Melanerpes formicivorus TaxID=211600 RepID=UPI00358FC7D7
MAPILDWKRLMKVDPDALPNQEKLAEKLLETMSKVDGKDLKMETPEQLIQLFKITQSLLKMKAEEVELALEEVEKAGEEQAKCENQFKTKLMKLENELKVAQRSAGGRDTRFLRDEIHQLEKQLEQKERQLTDTEKELEKEKKVNEQLALRNEDAENENIKLRREKKRITRKNEQLRQDVADYQREIDSQKEAILARRGEDSDYRSQLSKKNFELAQYLDEIQNLTEANEKLDIQNQEMRKNLEESVQEMEKMTDEYNKMKLIVQQSDIVMDQLRKEKEQYKFQVQELSDELKARNEEDDPLMAAVNEKVEEWKKILAAKDDELLEYQQMVLNLKEKMKMAQLDVDRNSIMALQQIISDLYVGVQDRDAQIRLLTEQVEQYTREMEQSAFVMEGLKNDLQKDKGHSSLAQQNHIEDMQEKLKMLEERTKEAEKSAELAEADAREKDKELVETLKRMRDYEQGIYGLEEAVAEIKALKRQIKVQDHEIETLIQEVNKLELKINDLLDENEELRERLGLEPKTMIDLNEFRNSKTLKQQQYRAENQVLLQEIERLEEERIELKKQVRKLAQEKGRKVATTGLSGVDVPNGLTEEEERNKKLDFMHRHDIAELKAKNEDLANELSARERELEKNRIVMAKLQSKLKELSEENKHLEQGMKEILQAVKEVQKDPGVKGGETALIIPTLDRLVNAMESRNSEGVCDVGVHLKAQVDQLTGRNAELRQELKEAQKEATNSSNQLASANEKIKQLTHEISSLRQTEGASAAFQTVNLPEGMAPSSLNVINSLNEYLIHLVQELENKEQLLQQFEEAVEGYKRKLAVIRHQQGLLYKEYQSQKESWQKESEKLKEEKKKLEEQKEQDAAKLKAYSNLLSALQLDPDETKKVLAETNRKITVLQVNERSLTRRYTTVLEAERHLRKENEKLKAEITQMEAAVMGRIGNLQRFKEMASFKIAALQKALDGSVPLSELELANKQYNALTAKYRDMLQKDNLLVQRTTNMDHMERENESLRSQMNSLSKELEITKEKLHTVEQAWEQMAKLGGDNAMDKATKAITNSEILSISKKITMLEMKELNERQRAEHSQRMYEHLGKTVKQLEERNLDLETKFAELTKINLEAQKVEQELRDELSKSVSKAVSDADKQKIMELEKHEMELKVEVSKLRELSDIAKMQVEALEARQQHREKEVESLRMQILDYQAQSDEKATTAKLHQHILALQSSESIAAGKVGTLQLKLQKMEIHNLRLEQKLDEREQALYFARLEGRNRAKYLQQTVQALRRQFSGALPLAQQEKFSKTMIQLQNDKLKVLEEVQQAQEERRNAENRALELELKLKGLEELVSALKDTRGAQKVIEWHMKMEELRLQELKLNREVVKQKEEVKYLHNIISEYESTITNLEEEIVQQNKFHEERQMAWDQREVELQRQLDLHEQQQHEMLSTALKLEEATGSVPDPALPLSQQLELALRKIQEHTRTILETRAACRSLEEKLKEKETALWKAEQNVLSRDKVINELRLRIPAASEREKMLAELGKPEDDSEYHQAMRSAHQVIASLQARLNHKDEVLKKYQCMLAKAREEQEELTKKHEEELSALYQKLHSHADNSFHKFKEELAQKASLALSNSHHLLRLAEMEQTVAEQDSALASLVEKLKKTSAALEKQKEITVMKSKEFEIIKARLQQKHAADVEQLKEEVNELRNVLSQVEKELANVKAELEVQKEANNRAPTTTLKNLVEQLKSQLAIKEKQQKALSRAILELRAEMTANAEQQIIAAASQKQAQITVQELVDRQTKGLMTQIEELNNQITQLTDNLKTSKIRESSLSDEKDELSQELQRKQKALAKVLGEKNEMDKENKELKKQLKRLNNSIQSKAEEQNLIDGLQKKVQKLESELEKCEETGKKGVREDKIYKEEIIRWEEGKKWQTRMEGLRNKLKEKEKDADALAKQLNTLKEIYTKTEREKATLQKKLKATGVTVDRVVGVRASETDRELEELRRRNLELENEVAHMRTQQAIPRDSVVEELHFKNQYLQEKLHVLERQRSRETYSRPLSTCDQNEMPRSVPISATKQKYLKFLHKKPLSNRDGTKPQNNLTIPSDSEIGEEADVQTCIGHKKGHEAAVDASPEMSPEASEMCKDTDIAREGLKPKTRAEADEENCMEKERNTPQGENGKLGEELEVEEQKQEILRQSNVDEGESLELPDPDRISCNQSGSREPSDQAAAEEAEKLNGNSEMNQHTAEDEHQTHQSATEGDEMTPELGEVPKTSGIASDDQCRREQELLKENLRLSTENVELRFQLEQANKDLPRLKDQVGDLKEMCELLKKEKAEAERKLGNVRGAGRSGKTIPELEKTVGLMKKVVERVQRENEELKKTPAVVSNEKLLGLEQENERLKSELEKMKLDLGEQLSVRHGLKTKGMEKVIAENERLRKELKKEADNGEKLRIAKSNLEILNEKLTVQLEETLQRLHLAERQLDGADSKNWKSIVTRMQETKMKEMEVDIAKKTQSIADLKRLLQETTKRVHDTDKTLEGLKKELELLKHLPEDASTEQSLIKKLQLLRLTNHQLQKEKAELAQQLEEQKHHRHTDTSGGPAAGCNGITEKEQNEKLVTKVAELQTLLKASELENQQLKEETKKLRKELDNFDPSFFEEIEDLKYNYNEELKKNILLEERLKKLSEELSIQVDSPGSTSADQASV